MAVADKIGDDVVLIISEREAKHLSALLRAVGGISTTREILTNGKDSLVNGLSNAGYCCVLRAADKKSHKALRPDDDSEVWDGILGEGEQVV